MLDVFSIARLGVVVAGSVDALGWLHGLAVVAAPATVRFR